GRLRRPVAEPRPDRPGGHPRMNEKPGNEGAASAAPASRARVNTGREIFECALIRVVPRIARGESINVGVIVYSKSFRFLKTRIELKEPRLKALHPAADLDRS